MVGHTAAFPLGGKAKPKVTWKSRINLTLGYDASMPNGQDIATQIRSRLENTGGLSVQLKPGATDADLNLVDRKAWTATALAWHAALSPCTLPAAASTVKAIETGDFARPRIVTPRISCWPPCSSRRLLNLTVLPISQSDEHVYVRRNCRDGRVSCNPGWQLRFFGISNG